VKIRLIQEEVLMSPGPVQGIMNLALLGLRTVGAGELGSLGKVEPEVQTALFLGELEIDDLPVKENPAFD
jgi:hypothetical protein